jgi:hypothetical protein
MDYTVPLTSRPSSLPENWFGNSAMKEIAAVASLWIISWRYIVAGD